MVKSDSGPRRHTGRQACWGALLSVVLLQGCPATFMPSRVDQDLVLQGIVSFASESAVFLLDNLARGL
jgi:hypothetical protein